MSDESISEPVSEKKSNSLIIIIALVLTLIVAGGGVWYFLLDGNKMINSKLLSGTEVAPQNTKAAIFLPMDEFVLDLVSTGRKNNFLKLKISLEIENQKDVEKITSTMPKIRDIFQTYLRSLREDDLRGNAGIDLLREELLLRVNKMIYPAVVSNILFSELVVN